MSGCAFAIFDTAIGRCALAWRGGLIVGAALPECSDAEMRRSMRRRFPEAEEEAPSAEALQAISGIVRLLSGEEEDFASMPVDIESLPDFERRVLQQTRRIPLGETRTYGELASTLGLPGAARAVGRALGRNPVPIMIPCHRVLAADGRSGGFSAPGGISTKLKILEIERARRGSALQLFDRLPFAVKPAR